ncbi:hypothetical protein JG687_00010405 [Phytophthora cactorum]|uniref:Uncharacterized protein n=1 Tax=Phytophthora cactorum TaxID=29920 RepID=A0A8T1U9N1_9STRA|nr:hypothetical protein PC120_g16203 [Phytophthora cactorum]KAG3052916.1 hypothetical protein PC121_g17080 [Phytophthora cactorum]KAG4048061.1 hypothetical protein PC123_g16605 [Phytophthora cactorum]KAG6956769.1 hypothetical protein JG687_00010405 [Phytophthora cactorum]
MGGNLSVVCGLAASDSDSDRDLQLHYQSKDFARSFDQPTSSRGRSSSAATDCSVASILSSSEQLIPDAYMPKDIQVLSQRRQRNGHHHHMASRSSFGFSGKNSSRVSSSSSRGLSSVRVVRNNAAGEIPASVNKKYNFGIKTASSSFGYSDDETPNTAAPIRGADSSRLSMQELRVK